MPIQWNDPAVKDRLLLAVLATMDKVDMHEIARIYGNGMTYNALENRFRKVRKEAQALKEEAGDQPIASTPSKSRGSKKAGNTKMDSVKTGRVTKAQQEKPAIKMEFSSLDEELLALAYTESDD